MRVANCDNSLPVAKVAKPWESGGRRTLEVRSEPRDPSFFVRLGYFSLSRSQVSLELGGVEVVERLRFEVSRGTQALARLGYFY